MCGWLPEVALCTPVAKAVFVMHGPSGGAVDAGGLAYREYGDLKQEQRLAVSGVMMAECRRTGRNGCRSVWAR